MPSLITENAKRSRATGVDPDDFNCLFCYCPLYALGEDCKGNFTYTVDGIKDCSNCNIPHHREQLRLHNWQI